MSPQPAPVPVPTKVKVGVILASLIVPLVGIVAGLMYQRSDDPEKKKVARPWLFISVGVFAVYSVGFCGKVLTSSQPVCYNSQQVAVPC